MLSLSDQFSTGMDRFPMFFAVLRAKLPAPYRGVGKSARCVISTVASATASRCRQFKMRQSRVKVSIVIPG